MANLQNSKLFVSHDSPYSRFRIPEGLTARQGLRHAGLDFKVTQRPVFYLDDHGNKVEIDTHLVNMRTPENDPSTPLGIVTKSYSTIQNETLATLMDTIAEETGNEFHCAAAGHVDGGDTCFVQLKGKGFGAGDHGNDKMEQYLFGYTSHTGKSSFKIFPMSMRLICTNQLSSIGVNRANRFEVSIRHTGTIDHKIADVRRNLRRIRHGAERTRREIAALSKKHLSTKGVEEFFTECYQHVIHAIPNAADCEGDDRKRERYQRQKAIDAFRVYQARYEHEADTLGSSNLWIAFNAFSGWVQHDSPVRSTNPDSLFKRTALGAAERQTREAFAHALSMSA